MDLSRLSSSIWSVVEQTTEAPDALIAAAVSSVATLALVLGVVPRLGMVRTGRAQEADDDACEFLITGGRVKPLSEPAHALLAGMAPGSDGGLTALSAHLSAGCPSLPADLEALALYGTGFRHRCARMDGTAVEICGVPQGTGARLTIRPASEDACALREVEDELVRTQAELRFLRDVIDQAPVLAWSYAPDGQVDWANAAYHDRFDLQTGTLPDHRIRDAFGHVLEEVPLTARGLGSRRRLQVPGLGDAEAHWYEVSQCPGPDGQSLGFALPADDLVAAEASLRRFVETLTETFAHLPIGLAVFDKNRRLGLFNPALTDLVKIDAVWLAGRPSLRDFLERLRETRQMPEQKDFASWRRKLTELEEGARDGTYEENWQLPSGKIFRVTGRPHPQGALAFLFEDISTSIMLERKYRSELELSQATLDRMSEAVAVFDASGMLVFVNAAFESLWGIEPMGALEGPCLAEMTDLWAEHCEATAAWGRLTEFTTAAEARSSWREAVQTNDGRRLELLVAPLPDASALVVFREAAQGDETDTFAALSLDLLRVPVEAAVPKIAAALAASPTPDAFRTLGTALQALKDGLIRSGELGRLSVDPSQGDTGSLLAAALKARGHALEVAASSEAAFTGSIRRSSMALGLAATELAAPGAGMTLSARPDGTRVSLGFAPDPVGSGGGLALALARRIVAAAGGHLSVETEDGATTLAATFPTRPETPLPAARAAAV